MSSYGKERGEDEPARYEEHGHGKPGPNPSDPGKCTLRTDAQGKIGCEKLSGCQFDCMLYSVPKDTPNVPQTQWVTEGIFGPGGFTPDPSRYYFCRCVEL